MPTAPKTASIQFTLNGTPCTLAVDPTRSALDVLRDELGIRSISAGCSPQGICGCCVALINDKPRVTCTLKAKSLEGKVVETHVGFSSAERAAITTAFSACGAAQCGYCTPGIVAQAVCLLRHVPHPDEETIDKAMSLHVCRCTGWTRIREAVQLAGQLLSSSPPEPHALPGGLSSPEVRAAILGERTRIDDMTRPGMLHLAVRFAPHPRCTLGPIDSAPALALADVVAVLTAADLPHARALDGWPLLIAPGEETRCAADVVALVVARSATAARAAARALGVSATPLPDPILHLDDGAVIDTIQRSWGTPPPEGSPDLTTVSLTVTTPTLDPAYLEPDAVLVVPGGAEGGLHVYSATQDPFGERAHLAAVLGQPSASIVVESVPCGGAFGGRSGAHLSAWAALAARHTGRPVHAALTHEETTRLHPAQAAARLTLHLRARPDAPLASLEADLWVDGGAWPGLTPLLLRQAAARMAGPYTTEHLSVTARVVQTHTPTTGALRGLGELPGTFALERALDQLAVAFSEDPLALRRRLLADPQAHAPVLDALEAPRRAAQAQGQAVGVACAAQVPGLEGAGPETARVVLEVRSPAEVCIHTGFAEAGQGFELRAIQAAAEASGLPPEVFTVQTSTLHPVQSGPTLAGVDRWLGVPAVIAAAQRLTQAAFAEADGTLAGLIGRCFTGTSHATDPQDSASAAGFAATLALLDARGGVARLIVAVNAGDEGRADPIGTSGQVEGAAHMGLGIALAEEKPVDAQGMPETQYRKLGVLKARASPPVQTLLITTPSSSGARAVDGAVLRTVPPAVAAALQAAGTPAETALPMNTSSAARAAGVRPARTA